MRSNIVAGITLAFMLATTSVYAQENFCYEGTRALSLGKAFVGLADDENALCYNPAGLAQIRDQKLSISGIYQYYSWESTSPSLYFTVSYIEHGLSLAYIRQGIGISFNILGRGWWDEITVYDRPVQPEPLGTVRPVFYERNITVAYAREIYSGLILGMSGKYVNTSDPFEEVGMSTYNETHGGTLDIGILYHTLDKLSFGLHIGNIISTDVDYSVFNDSGSWLYLNELPRNVALGLAYRPFENLILLADVRNLFEDDVFSDIHQTDYTFKRSYHMGCEWRVIPEIFLRVGYFRSSRPSTFTRGIIDEPFEYEPFEYDSYNNFTLGFGFKHRRFQADLGMKIDNRKSKMEENPIRLTNTTLLGIASLSLTY